MKSLAKCLVAGLTLVVASTGFAQQSLVGSVIVSNPSVADSNFSESVLLIIFHDNDIGTAGVLLNRPTWVDPTEVFPEIDAWDAYDDRLYLGGPVAPTDLWTLIESDAATLEGTQPVAGRIHVGLDPEILNRIDFTAEQRPAVRVYAGRAEWGPGQLADEIAAGSWRLLSARPEDVFADDPENLWERMPLTSDGVTASLR